MAEIVTMPKLGFDMAEGTLVRWVIAEGEPVEKGGVLAEIETDKATVEVESAYSGVVTRHLVAEGTPVPVGEPIAIVGAAGEVVALGQGAVETAPKAETTLQPAAPLEAQAALPSAAAGEPAAGVISTSAAAPAAQVEDGRLPGGLRASPLARRLAEERSIDLRQLKGSGPGGRITKADVEAYRPPALAAAAQLAVPEPAAAAPAAAGTPRPAPAFAPRPAEPAGARPDRRVPLSKLRAIIGRRMVESLHQAPHFFITHAYDVAKLIELRKQVNAILPEAEKVSVNDFIVKAAALTLREFPNLNARLDEPNNQVIQFGQINIGNAVSVENGLLTVVVKDADLKSLRQLAGEVKALAERARAGKVRPDDIAGSTFSVSNLGMYAVEHFVAIINPPEAAILAVGSARQVPVVKDGALEPGWRLNATLSVDHRVSDGAEGARFLQALAKYIEEPLLALV